jgi:cytosine/creatinine deaminase
MDLGEGIRKAITEDSSSQSSKLARRSQLSAFSLFWGVELRKLEDCRLNSRATMHAHKEHDMKPFITADTAVTDEALNTIAYLPTKSLPQIIDPGFFRKLSDRDFMRLAFLLAKKSYDEGGSPIGAVIVKDATRQIVGKGHNTLVQENHPYNHGETCAVRDAGRIDFSETTIFTSLSPCEICAVLIYMRQFHRIVVGDVTNASGNEELLRHKGIQVDILEDPEGVALYAKYRREKPEQDLEDWKGLAAVRHGSRS